MRLQGRVAIVTGASRGVGRAVALGLAREGADVVLAAKTMEPDPRLPGTLMDVAREVEALGRRALAVRTDVRSVEQIEAMVARARAEFGRIDILVNNAGALWWTPVLDTPEKRFDLVMGVNVRAAFFASRAVLPHMIRQRWGHIVNMSPPIDVRHVPGRVAYMVSKFGMTMLTYGLAEEVREHNVAVHSLWPVTAVESWATIHFGIGSRETWRKPDIRADATVALVTKEPSLRTGKAWLDEEVLREEGVTDFSGYACVPGTSPPPIGW